MALMRSGLSGWLDPGWCCRNIGCEIHTVRAFLPNKRRRRVLMRQRIFLNMEQYVSDKS